jgi:hypothetical protein
MTNAVRKIAPAALAAAALVVAPAYAAGHGHGPNAHAHTHGQHGNSHKCRAHKVGWVVRGTLTAVPSLTTESDGGYSGDVAFTVTHTNHHARDFQGDQTITLSDVKASFDVADTNGDGVDAGDLAVGDQVKLIGKIEKVAKKCDTTPSSDPTIRKAVFASPETDTQDTGDTSATQG